MGSRIDPSSNLLNIIAGQSAIYRKYSPDGGVNMAGVEGGGQENVTGEGEKNWVMHRHAGCVMLRERHAR